jgi:hypothetical protein
LPGLDWLAIMPDVDVEGLIEACRRDVADGDFTVMALVGDELGCDWAYTIGLDRNFGHPELLIVGLEAELGGIALELLGRRVAEGEQFVPGQSLVLDGGLEFRPSPVDPLFASCGDWFVLGREVMACWGQRWPSCLQLVWSEQSAEDGLGGGSTQGSLRQPLLFGA